MMAQVVTNWIKVVQGGSVGREGRPQAASPCRNELRVALGTFGPDATTEHIIPSGPSSAGPKSSELLTMWANIVPATLLFSFSFFFFCVEPRA